MDVQDRTTRRSKLRKVGDLVEGSDCCPMPKDDETRELVRSIKRRCEDGADQADKRLRNGLSGG